MTDIREIKSEDSKEIKPTKGVKIKTISKRLLMYFIWAMIVNLIIETLARKNLGGFIFLIDKPLIFLYNSLLIFASLSLALLSRRRKFFFSLITAFWLLIGVVNGVILIERMTPFTVKDLSALTDAATILTNYFNRVHLFAIATAIVLGTIGLMLLWIRVTEHAEKKGYKRAPLAFLIAVALAFSSSFILIKSNTLATFFGNLAYAYRDYGVPYCFMNTWLNTGIHKPPEYSEEEVKKLLGGDQKNARIVKDPSFTDEKNAPNIIFLQMESFTDPLLFNRMEYSRDPMPNMRALMKNYSSGYLTVPACGAGTANTEFEMMTGLSIKFFGPGEYPFKSVLKKAPAESLAFDLKSLGYSSHAVHNHRAMFYNRKDVFQNIGYDNFTSVEYMSDVPKTPKNWAKDSILTGEIMKDLNATKGRDYIYTISTQGHGKYPTEQLIANPAVSVTKAPNEAMKWKYEYYVNQVYEMDEFINDLVHKLDSFDEPVILAIYGDHIPALDISEDSYDRGLYETPYVIWSNFPMEKQDGNIKAYEFTSSLLSRLGIHTGTIFTYQQDTENKGNDYIKGLKTLGYDILYGNLYSYNGNFPFKPADMKMGVYPVKIDRIVKVGNKYFIKGENFTEYSKVTLGGRTLKTMYLSPTMLGLEEKIDPDDVSSMKVSQIDKSNKEIITSTE
jgi:phosphoglycerol transferase MdoB-like AlkP superfamily enzyme